MSTASDVIQRIARWINPVIGSPAGPLETTVFVDSFGPSLMPRTSVHQGVATGLSVLAARGPSPRSLMCRSQSWSPTTPA